MVSVLTLRCCLLCAPRYTTNTTEFPYNLWLYQKYYDIERIGWGLYPTHTWNNSARPRRAHLTSAFRRFVCFGAWIMLMLGRIRLLWIYMYRCSHPSFRGSTLPSLYPFPG